jgi:hypothetical protein
MGETRQGPFTRSKMVGDPRKKPRKPGKSPFAAKAKPKAKAVAGRTRTAPKTTQRTPKRKGVQTSKISAPTKVAKFTKPLKRRSNVKRRDI